MPINSIEEGCQLRKLWVALQTNILVEIFKAILYYAIFAKCEIMPKEFQMRNGPSVLLVSKNNSKSRLCHLLRDSVG